MAKKIHEWIGLSSIAYFDVLREALGGHEAATRIHCRVRNALLLDAHLRSFWRFVEEHEEKPEYDLSTFAYNVQCIVEDADNGADWPARERGRMGEAGDPPIQECGVQHGAVSRILGTVPTRGEVLAAAAKRGRQQKRARVRINAAIHGEAVMRSTCLWAGNYYGKWDKGV